MFSFDLKNYWITAVIFLSLSSSVIASGYRLKPIPFEYYAEGESLRNVLTALATNSGVGIYVSETVVDSFNGHLQQKTTRAAMQYLAKAYDLIWYFDGSTLHVNKSDDMKSQMFRLNLISADRVKQTMRGLNIWDSQFDWRAIEDTNILMVSGPPRYLELVTKTISILQEGLAPDFSDPLEIKIFKLKYASAIDRKITARGEDITIPGIATVLTNMVGDGGKEEKTNVEMLERNGLGSQPDNPEKNSTQQNKIISNGTAHPLVQIQADMSLNAVIIQDYRSRLALYQRLIDQLDQPRDQLEISLKIIDMTTNSLQEMGIDWTVRREVKGGGLIDLILPGASELATTTVANTSAKFLASVSLLETKGQARVVSRPAVVTENGIQAVLDNNETFYVRVQGERVAELEAITYGTLLQVTPRIIRENIPNRIYLDINIQDGNRLQDGGVESLPTIKNTQISTRASVPDGASLLIGGYYRESTSNNNGQVPGLGSIPLLGRLFSHDADTKSQMVRLFMISPRVLPKNESSRPTETDFSQPFSFSQQLNDLSNLSNADDSIYRIGNLQPCETAREARTRRNQFIRDNYTTAITACRNPEGKKLFRVTLSQCPKNAKEPECQL